MTLAKKAFVYWKWGSLRVSLIAYVAKDLEGCLPFAENSLIVTHNSLEGITSAKAIA